MNNQKDGVLYIVIGIIIVVFALIIVAMSDQIAEQGKSIELLTGVTEKLIETDRLQMDFNSTVVEVLTK